MMRTVGVFVAADSCNGNISMMRFVMVMSVYMMKMMDG